MGDSGKDVVRENTGPSGAFRNFEVGSRFLQVSEQETSEFVKNNRNKNTTRKTKGNVKILYNWLTEVCTEARKFYEIPPPELNMYLARFFLSVRRPDGSEYEPETLRGFLGILLVVFVKMAISTTLLNHICFLVQGKSSCQNVNS